MQKNEESAIKKEAGDVNCLPAEMNLIGIPKYNYMSLKVGEMNVGFGIKEMATQIAAGIFQSEIMMNEVKELVSEAKKSGLDRTSMQYVSIMAVETAHWIDEYSKHWNDGGKKDGT